MPVRVWLPDYYERAAFDEGAWFDEREELGGRAAFTGRERFGDLGAAVEIATFPEDPLAAPDLDEVEFVVPPYRPEEVLRALPRMRALKVVQTDSAGVEWLAGKVPAGVTLCNARGVYDAATSEWVLAAILASTKRLPEALENQRAGRWRRSEPDELAGKTVAIVGYGSIGRAVAARLEPFGVDLVRVARRARPGVLAASELRSVLPEANVVILLAPLTAETRGLVDERFLAGMRPGALLVNAARGALVDTDALVRALQAGRLRAALDVTDPEPLPDDHPLWRAPGALITPHLAGDSPRAIPRAAALIREQLRRYLDGRPLLNVVE